MSAAAGFVGGPKKKRHKFKVKKKRHKFKVKRRRREFLIIYSLAGKTRKDRNRRSGRQCFCDCCSNYVGWREKADEKRMFLLLLLVMEDETRCIFFFCCYYGGKKKLQQAKKQGRTFLPRLAMVERRS